MYGKMCPYMYASISAFHAELILVGHLMLARNMVQKANAHKNTQHKLLRHTNREHTHEMNHT